MGEFFSPSYLPPPGDAWRERAPEFWSNIDRSESRSLVIFLTFGHKEK
jgi:hypothetical protein